MNRPRRVVAIAIIVMLAVVAALTYRAYNAERGKRVEAEERLDAERAKVEAEHGEAKAKTKADVATAGVGAAQGYLAAACRAGDRGACQLRDEIDSVLAGLDRVSNEAEVQERELQEREIQEREAQEREEQQAERDDEETQDRERDDAEVQDDEVQDDEINDPDPDDPENQDPEVDDPDPNDPDPDDMVQPGSYSCPDGQYVVGFDITSQGAVSLTCRLLPTFPGNGNQP